MAGVVSAQGGWSGLRRSRETPAETPPEPAAAGSGLTEADVSALVESLEALGQGSPAAPSQAGLSARGTFLVRQVGRASARAVTAQAMLEREQLHVGGLLEATSEGVCVQDLDGTITFMNKAGLRMLGYQRDALVGQDAHSVLHTDRKGCPVETVLLDAIASSSQTSFRKSQGHRLPVDVHVAPVVHDGVVAEIICVFSDATARIARETAQQEAFAATAAALLAQQELNAQKVDFVSTVSHELRTPLTSVLGYLDLITEGLCGTYDEGVGEKLVIIERNARRLLTQVEALLLVSRIESGAISVNMGELDLAEAVRDSVETVQPQAAAKGLTLDVDAPVAFPAIRGDTSQVAGVLLNLLSNAVKFTPYGGEIGLSVVIYPRHIEVQVADTGMGIPEAEQGRLFEKFFRSSISQQQAVQGTGLGLAIVKAVVEEHGGRIGVSSQEGVGTTVAFTLPLPNPSGSG